MIDYVIEKQDDLRYFDFWSGAKQTAELINNHSKADEIWEYLEEYISDSNTERGYITDTLINDFIWFDACEVIKEDLDIDLYSDEEEDEDEEDEDEEDED